MYMDQGVRLHVVFFNRSALISIKTNVCLKTSSVQRKNHLTSETTRQQRKKKKKILSIDLMIIYEVIVDTDKGETCSNRFFDAKNIIPAKANSNI